MLVLPQLRADWKLVFDLRLPAPGIHPLDPGQRARWIVHLGAKLRADRQLAVDLRAVQGRVYDLGAGRDARRKFSFGAHDREVWKQSFSLWNDAARVHHERARHDQSRIQYLGAGASARTGQRARTPRLAWGQA